MRVMAGEKLTGRLSPQQVPNQATKMTTESSLYPMASVVNRNELNITLLRDGKEETHTFYKGTAYIVSPETRPYYMLPRNTPDYFLYAPHHQIELTKEEATTLEQKIHEVEEAQQQQEMAEEAAKECSHCGKTQGECADDYDVDAEWENNNWDSRY